MSKNLLSLRIQGMNFSKSRKMPITCFGLINDLLDLSRAEIDELSIAPEFIDPIAILSDVFDAMADRSSTAEKPFHGSLKFLTRCR